MSIIKELRSKFPLFKCMYSNGTYHGKIHVSQINETAANKSRMAFGAVSIFISSIMRKGREDSFFYALCSQSCDVIPYRCRNSYNLEHGKIYVSAKTVDDIMEKLIKDVDMSVYRLNKSE